jgi:chorismate dehydratase
MSRQLRIGAVNYLNARPLVAGLHRALPAAEIRYEVPSRLADLLASRELDLALAPCVELTRHPDWRLVTNACIGCRGPVLSVKLLFRTAPRNVRTLAVDEGSRTSVILSQVLLADIAGVRPTLSLLPLEMDPTASTADAVLVIGDRAMGCSQEGFVESWDVGDRWNRFTELPIVFAGWIAGSQFARFGDEIPAIEDALNACRDRGLAEISTIVDRESAAMGLPREVVHAYLTRNLNYYLDPGERRGMEHFFSRAESLGFLPAQAQAKGENCGVNS